MHYLILLSYAFSIWMIVDAYQRGAQGWWIVIILVPFGEFIYFVMVKMQDFDLGGGASVLGGSHRFKCARCQYCVMVYRNGVKCQIRDTPVFKTPTQIDYCASYTQVESSR